MPYYIYIYQVSLSARFSYQVLFLVSFKKRSYAARVTMRHVYAAVQQRNQHSKYREKKNEYYCCRRR